MQAENKATPYLQYQGKAFHPLEKPVPAEALVGLNVNGEEWLTFTCTPVQHEALAAGFLFNEGVIQSAEELASLHLCASGTLLDVWLEHSAQKPERWTRTSGCAGGQTAQRSVERVAGEVQFEAEEICVNMEAMLHRQETYRESGGLHCSALSGGESIQFLAEDIGRHNTLDKLAGALLLNPLELPRRLLLTTGRVSSEMLQKAARMQVSVIASRTSPTALSVTLAEQAGIALAGYVRRGQFNLYTHPERIRA